jgi:hypothetical protein
MATCRLSEVWTPRYTTAMPPCPMGSLTSYDPRILGWGVSSCSFVPISHPALTSSIRRPTHDGHALLLCAGLSGGLFFLRLLTQAGAPGFAEGALRRDWFRGIPVAVPQTTALASPAIQDTFGPFEVKQSRCPSRARAVCFAAVRLECGRGCCQESG